MKDREWAEKLLDEYERLVVVLASKEDNEDYQSDDHKDYAAFREQIILHLTNVPEGENDLGDKDV